MTADEIRNYAKASRLEPQYDSVLMLAEIAAQLAELNATLNSFSSRAVEGGAMLDVRVNQG